MTTTEKLSDGRSPPAAKNIWRIRSRVRELVEHAAEECTEPSDAIVHVRRRRVDLLGQDFLEELVEHAVVAEDAAEIGKRAHRRAFACERIPVGDQLTALGSTCSL